MTTAKAEPTFIPVGETEKVVNQSIPANSFTQPDRRPITTQADLEQGQTTSETPEGEPVDDAAQASSGESQQEGLLTDPVAQQNLVFQEMLRKIQEMDQRQNQADQDKVKTSDDLAAESAEEAQKMQLEQQKVEALGLLETQLAEIQKQMENGDLDMPLALSKQTALQRQLLQTENQFDKQIASIDLRLEQQQIQQQQFVADRRKNFLATEDGQEFAQNYDRLKQQYGNDPVLDVMAGFYSEKAQAYRAEVDALKEQLGKQAESVKNARRPDMISPVASSGVATTGQQQKNYPRGAAGTYQRLVDQGVIQAT
jgi:hypothetical protein